MLRRRAPTLGQIGKGFGTWLLIFLSATGSGCLGASPDVVHVPSVGFGDSAEYSVAIETNGNMTLHREVHIEVGQAARVEFDDASLVDAVEVTVTTKQIKPNGTVAAELVAVSRGDLMAIKRTELCGEGQTSSCGSRTSEALRGLPWGFGTGLLQGNAFEKGRGVSQDVFISGVPLRLTIDTVKAWTSGGHASAKLEVELGGAHYVSQHTHDMLQGAFVVSEDSAFPVSAEVEFSSWVDVLQQNVTVRVQAQRTSFSSGGGEPIFGDDSPPDRRTCLPAVESFQGGLPPGANQIVPPLTASLAEFRDALIADHSAVRTALDRPGAFILHQWMLGATNTSAALVVAGQQAVSRIDVLVSSGQYDWYRVTRNYDRTLIYENTSYSSTHEGMLGSSVALQEYKTPLVSVADLLEKHFSEGAPNSTPQIVGFLVEGGPVMTGGWPASLHPKLFVRYDNGTSGADYSLETGCLVKEWPV